MAAFAWFSHVALTGQRAGADLAIAQTLVYGVVFIWSIVLPYFVSHFISHLKSSGLLEFFIPYYRSKIRIFLETVLPVYLFSGVVMVVFLVMLRLFVGTELKILLEQLLFLNAGAFFVIALCSCLAIFLNPALCLFIIPPIYLFVFLFGTVIQRVVDSWQSPFIAMIWQCVPRFDLFHPIHPLIYLPDLIGFQVLSVVYLKTFILVALALFLSRDYLKPSLK